MSLTLRALVFVAALSGVGCSGGHSGGSSPADPHPISADFDAVAGSWNAVCIQAASNQPGTVVNDTASFTVDRRGHLVGLDQGGRSLDLYLTRVGTISRYRCALVFSDSTPGSLQIDVPPTTTPGQAALQKGAAMPIIWTLTQVSGPG